MKNILVTGSNGQLGNELRLLSVNYPDYNFLFTDVAELNICDKEAIDVFFRDKKIDYVINCAAYTAVDKAESDALMCRRINAEAVEYLAEAAAAAKARMIHVSTDYVYSGTSCVPYVESDLTDPVSMYGITKLEGEHLLFSFCKEAIILRTAWLYSAFGNNFVKTMIRLGKERDQLNVVFDQVGTPTYARDLAQAILDIISSGHFEPGIYNYSDEGVCSWYDFAVKIHQLAGVVCQVNPIETWQYPAPAKRPSYSVLNKKKIKDTYHLTIPHWEASLAHCIKRLEK